MNSEYNHVPQITFVGGGISICGCCCWSVLGVGGGTGDELETIFEVDDDDDDDEFVGAVVGRRIERAALVLVVPDGR